MLEGWYCRSIANNNAAPDDDDEDSPEEEVPNYKDQYRNLKRKLKFLIYVRSSISDAHRRPPSLLYLFMRPAIVLGERVFPRSPAVYAEETA